MKSIFTKYSGPTDTRGARINVTDQDGNRMSVSYEHGSSDPHLEAIKAFCAKMDWHGELIIGHSKDGRVAVFAKNDRITV